ncbi:MAG: hypothetical protein Q4D71_08720, partial [Oscillospiraceae bacterium]|nr:hypothetical protein [Oscillospiraceae bacterium]
VTQDGPDYEPQDPEKAGHEINADTETDAPVSYVKNIKKNSVLGYRYFDLTETESISLELHGKGKGEIQILSAEDGRPAATLQFEGSDGWTTVGSKLDTAAMLDDKGGHEALKKMPILIKFLGRGKIDLKSFTLS